MISEFRRKNIMISDFEAKKCISGIGAFYRLANLMEKSYSTS